MFVKVCGITLPEQIDAAVEFGYTAIGIVMHEKSPRYCSPEKALRLIEKGSGRIKTVAVGYTFSEVEAVADAADFIQLYEENDIYAEKLILAGNVFPEGKQYRYFLYDSSHGKGIFSAAPGWVNPIRERLIFSGGLNCDNVSEVIKTVRPFGIDVSSGLEIRRGVKDFALMKRFMKEVNNAVE